MKEISPDFPNLLCVCSGFAKKKRKINTMNIIAYHCILHYLYETEICRGCIISYMYICNRTCVIRIELRYIISKTVQYI